MMYDRKRIKLTIIEDGSGGAKTSRYLGTNGKDADPMKKKTAFFHLASFSPYDLALFPPCLSLKTEYNRKGFAVANKVHLHRCERLQTHEPFF